MSLNLQTTPAAWSFVPLSGRKLTSTNPSCSAVLVFTSTGKLGLGVQPVCRSTWPPLDARPSCTTAQWGCPSPLNHGCQPDANEPGGVVSNDSCTSPAE